MVNVGKYTIHGSYGVWSELCSPQNKPRSTTPSIPIEYHKVSRLVKKHGH